MQYQQFQFKEINNIIIIKQSIPKMLPQIINPLNFTYIRDRMQLAGTMNSPGSFKSRPKLTTYVTFRSKLKYQRPAPLLATYSQNLLQLSGNRTIWSMQKKKEQGQFRLRKCDSEWRLEHFEIEEEKKAVRVSQFDTSQRKQQETNYSIQRSSDKIEKSIIDKRSKSQEFISQYCKLPQQSYNNYKCIFATNLQEQRKMSLPKFTLSRLIQQKKKSLQSDKLQDCINNIQQQTNTGYTDKLNELKIAYNQKQEAIEKQNQNDQLIQKMKKYKEKFEQEHVLGNSFVGSQNFENGNESQVSLFFNLFGFQRNLNKLQFMKITKREQQEKQVIQEFQKLVEISLTQAQEMDGRLPILIKANQQQYTEEKQMEIAILEKFTNEKSSFLIIIIFSKRKIKQFHSRRSFNKAFPSILKQIKDHYRSYSLNPKHKSLQQIWIDKIRKLLQIEHVGLTEGYQTWRINQLYYLSKLFNTNNRVQFFSGNEKILNVQDFKRILRILTDQVDSLSWRKKEQVIVDSQSKRPEQSSVYSDLIAKLTKLAVLEEAQQGKQESEKLVDLDQLRNVLLEMKMDVHELSDLIFKDYSFKKIIQY